MGSEKREDIGSQWNSQEANKLNNMLRWIWYKLHGDINFSDVNPNVKAQMFTYPLQPQGEGNLDENHPFYLRFYIPAEVKKINSASLNAIVSRYRMDSDVAVSIGQQTTAAVVTSGPSTVESAPVQYWGPYSSITTPTQPTTGAENITSLDPVSDGYIADGYYVERGSSGRLTMAVSKAVIEGDTEVYAWVDMYRMQHQHNIQHSHSGSANITIEGHGHDLNEGIKESSVQPSDVEIFVNDVKVGSTMSESNAAQNNIDILANVKPGQWNIVKITTNNLARITIYGIIELIQQYTNNI